MNINTIDFKIVLTLDVLKVFNIKNNLIAKI